MKRDLKVWYTNADQFPNKKDELCFLLADDPVDIIVITEVIPKAQVYSLQESALNINGYSVVSNFGFSEENLGASGKRGILIYTAKDLRVTEVKMRTEYEEQIWIQIEALGQYNILLGCVYRSPNSSSENSQALLALLREVASNPKFNQVVVMGDVNIGKIDWESWTVQPGATSLSQDFLECVEDCFLTQHVHEPTRYRVGNEPSILDLIMTSEEDTLSDLDYYPGLGRSDHCCLRFKINITTYRKSKQSRYNFHMGKYDIAKGKLMRIKWEEDMRDLSVEEACILFSEKIRSVMEETIPKHRDKAKPSQLYMNKNTLKLRALKFRLWLKWRKSGDDIDGVRYTRISNQLRKETRKLRRAFEEDIAKNITHTPKPFWKYVKSKLKSKVPIGDITAPDGSSAVSDKDKADALNDFFKTVFTVEECAYIPELSLRTEEELSVVTVAEEAVCAKLKLLNTGKSSGPDGLHPRFLRETANEVAIPLTIIYKKSLETGQVPSLWKEANVTAIHKGGDKREPNNYRPVSLTAVPCKILEGFVRSSIIQYMMQNDLFCDNQHGFVPGRCCTSQLLETLEDWTKMLDEGGGVDVAYMDFKKAFDCVPHCRLLRKLEAYGIKGKLLEWIKDFLTGRRQRVLVNGEESSWCDITSGIPQGSVLGPVLFVIFINDLPDDINGKVKMYADDTKMYRRITAAQDHQDMQADLERLDDWSKKWQLRFNEKKCKIMHLGKQEKESYNLGNSVMSVTEGERDLGVFVDRELKFHQQTAMTVKKANRMLGLIQRTFSTRNRSLILPLYKTMVRPILEYGNVAWGPIYETDKVRIEKVQRRATRLISEVRELSYEKRLQSLNIPSLEHRRYRSDMVQMFKIMKEAERIDSGQFFERVTYDRTRGHSLKIKKPRSHLLIRQRFFSSRSVSAWNSLPQTLIDSDNVHQFKRMFDKMQTARCTRPL